MWAEEHAKDLVEEVQIDTTNAENENMTDGQSEACEALAKDSQLDIGPGPWEVYCNGEWYEVVGTPMPDALRGVHQFGCYGRGINGNGALFHLWAGSNDIRTKKRTKTVYVNLYPNGYASACFCSRDLADKAAAIGRTECREITWEVE